MQVDLNQVYTIKIANGDEIVAKITENFPGYYVVVSPEFVHSRSWGNYTNK